MINNIDVGVAIRLKRQEQGMSRHMLAEAIGNKTTADKITKLEAGELALTARLGFYLCAALRCTMDGLMIEASNNHNHRTASKRIKSADKLLQYMIDYSEYHGCKLLRRDRPIADDINAALGLDK